MRQAWEYKGHLVMPMGRNSWGGRWEVRCPHLPAGRVAADTKEGIREAITEAHAHDGRCSS